MRASVGDTVVNCNMICWVYNHLQYYHGALVRVNPHPSPLRTCGGNGGELLPFYLNVVFALFQCQSSFCVEVGVGVGVGVEICFDWCIIGS